MRRAPLLLAVLLAVPTTASAKRAPAPDKPVQIVSRPRPLPPPVLMVRRNRISRPLQMTKVDIKATIVGHLARTEMTMTFYNPNSRAMAGDCMASRGDESRHAAGPQSPVIS